MIRSFAVFIALIVSHSAFAAECTDVFPDGVSNAANAGTITFNWQAQVLNSPDGILDTGNLTDNSGGASCDGSACAASNSSSEEGNFNTFPNNQPDISLGYQQTQTVSPGDYDDLQLNSEAVLTMEPGVYAFRGDLTLQSSAEIIVDSPGTVVIYVRGDVIFNSQSNVNLAAGDRRVFLFSRSNISLGFDTEFNGVIFARGNVALSSSAEVTGAITARGDITLGSPAIVNYDISAINNTEFDGFCESTVITLPEPIAEWRLDELSWTGASNDVEDATGNGFVGQAINDNGLPTTAPDDPAIAGDPGTCGYGEFNGTGNGYIEIPDPGATSDLDQQNNFTVTTWIYPYAWATSGLATIVSKDTNWEFHLNGSGRINWWWGGGSRSLTSSASVPLNEWHHIAITYESGDQRIYLDGVQVGTQTATTAPSVNNRAVYIGTDWNFHSRRFNGRIDEVRYYADTLSQAQVQADMALTHDCVADNSLSRFDIDIGGGNASVCDPQEITISARDDSDAVLTGYTGTITISTSTNNGDWDETTDGSDAQGVLAASGADSGAATYVFEATGLDEGEIILNLDNQRAETLTITVSDSSEGISSDSAAITFSENTFVVEQRDVLGDDVIAGRRHEFSVEMWEQAPSGADDTNCVVASYYQATTIKAWASRSSADPGGENPNIDNSDLSDSAELQDTELAAEEIDLNFVAGRAEFSLDTTDVGQFSLEFLDDTLAFSDQVIRGGSSILVARPFAFQIDVAGNAAASSNMGPVYLTAGAYFGVTVTALGWSASDDLDSDGKPDIYDDTDITNNQNLNGSVLPSFGQESPAASVQLSAQLVLPAAAVSPPGLGTDISDSNVISSFTDGSGTAVNRFYADVGIIKIDANIVGEYLGADDTNKSDSSTGFVGRFIPSYFSLEAIDFDEACGSFSYLDQPRDLGLNIEAKNTRGETTENYQGDFAKLTLSLGNIDIGAIDNMVPTPLSSRVSEGDFAINWSNGAGDISAAIVLERDADPEPPFTDVTLGLILVDDDDVTFRSSDLNLDVNNDSTEESINIGAGEYRFGRLVLPGVHGPESTALVAGFETQYWTGSAWLTSASDNCTAIAASDIEFQDLAVNSVVNREVTIGAGSSTGTFTNEDLAEQTVLFSDGSGGLAFSAPGTGNTGTINVDIDLTAYPWLRFDWDQNGSFDDGSLPTAEFTFGSYRGHDRIIYWQELLSN